MSKTLVIKMFFPQSLWYLMGEGEVKETGGGGEFNYDIL
jgi:hypothetical protein